MGQILGAAVSAALFGALIAWVLRKVMTNVTLRQSYALGVILMVFIAPALYVVGSDGALNYGQAWIIYAIGGVIGYGILHVTARKPRDNAPV
ncbi:hypothetical protein KEU06_08225 [Pseudaminobacter sp. 19-2017]|uniref:Uncharacterized protein n=1 Tax=Pseudaminobacter soli (ex Zhang et al. 2022) TaxID=2831468 RepID=A0A942DWI1_9HYPH|nr:hypothetical protein [Pseudaminobacter soli]MBS3648614.1 hypothetical protein [Pseudaminobacter soli]